MTDKVWVMVECISTFRERYMVEAPAEHPAEAGLQPLGNKEDPFA
jgi:hypothetical protein